MTVSSVAEFFQVSSYTIRDWIKQGKLDAIKINKQWRVKTASVYALAQITYGEEMAS